MLGSGFFPTMIRRSWGLLSSQGNTLLINSPKTLAAVRSISFVPIIKESARKSVGPVSMWTKSMLIPKGPSPILRSPVLYSTPEFASRMFHQSTPSMNEPNKQDNKKKEGDNKDPDPNNPQLPPIYLAVMLAGLVLSWLIEKIADKSDKSPTKVLSWDSFHTDYLIRNQVSKIELDKQNAIIYLKQNPDSPSFIVRTSDINDFVARVEDAQSKLGLSRDFFVPISTVTKSNSDNDSSILSNLIMIGVFALLLYLSRANPSQMSGPSNLGGGGKQDQLLNKLFGKQKAIFKRETDIKVSFKDVEGIDEAKLEVMELVHFLKNSEKYDQIGAKIPRGALLIGEPGTGKTLLARAIAGEAGIPFLSTSGSEFVEMYVGVGAARVRDLFEEARKSAPCIVFIDEIDAIGKSRNNSAMRSNDERESCLNQLLVEMDGFSSTSNVIVLASTNIPDVLDPALLRPGRFDRQVHVPKPDLKGRLAIFQLHMKNIKVDGSMEEICKKLALRTPGLAGADIANICNEGAIVAVRKNKTVASLQEFNEAIDRVTLGFERKGMVINPNEKRVIAYHEAGHAIVSWFLKHTNHLTKVSIIPRGKGALGFAAVEQTEKFLLSDEEMDERMCVYLGGRVSEEIFFGSVTTGAQNDLMQVTRLAYSKVKALGMNPKIGLLSFSSDNESFQKPYSENTGQIIDEEVRLIVDNAYQKTKNLLIEKKALVTELAEKLLRNETLVEADIETILGPRPHRIEKLDFDQRVNESNSLKTPSQTSPAVDSAPSVTHTAPHASNNPDVNSP